MVKYEVLQARIARLTRFLIHVALIGFVVSVYGLYVEVRLEWDPDYVAACDLSSYISCTKALSSESARGFGIVGLLLGDDHILNQKNALYGVVGYAILATIQLGKTRWAVLVSVLAGLLLNATSIYLFFLLTKMGLVCLVCYSIYVVNIAFVVGAWKRFVLVRQLNQTTSRPPSTKKSS